MPCRVEPYPFEDETPDPVTAEGILVLVVIVILGLSMIGLFGLGVWTAAERLSRILHG